MSHEHARSVNLICVGVRYHHLYSFGGQVRLFACSSWHAVSQFPCLVIFAVGRAKVPISPLCFSPTILVVLGVSSPFSLWFLFLCLFVVSFSLCLLICVHVLPCPFPPPPPPLFPLFYVCKVFPLFYVSKVAAEDSTSKLECLHLYVGRLYCNYKQFKHYLL